MRPLRECTDEELLALVVADCDHAAFTALVERYEAMMLRLCLHVLHERHDAEDARQVAFVVLWRNAKLIRDRGKFEHWLRCVTKREALRILKGKHQQEKYENSDEWDLLAQPLDEAATQERRIIVIEELRFLPKKYRDSLVWCYLKGMSKAEVAVELGLREGTVSSRLARGRDQLRKRLVRRGIVSAS